MGGVFAADAARLEALECLRDDLDWHFLSGRTPGQRSVSRVEVRRSLVRLRLAIGACARERRVARAAVRACQGAPL